MSVTLLFFKLTTWISSQLEASRGSPVKELSEIVKTFNLVHDRTAGHNAVRLLISRFNDSNCHNAPACSESEPFKKFSERFSFKMFGK